jgi:6-pyruvoyltetrahydropterin/6-carboxytetrahydropterin synthase
VKLTRRVSFSSGHRYWINSLPDDENLRLFGKWASRYNHGHNYVLDVTAEGEVDGQTGMVVNIKDIDAVLQREIVARFDQRSLNDEDPYFSTRSASLENFIRHIAELLSTQFSGSMPVALTHLRLEEMPTLWAELDLQTNMITLTRTYEFAASHRLHVPTLSNEQNIEMFGKCNNPAGHGHNYVLEVTVSGDPNPETGMLTDLATLDAEVERRIVDRYDHRNFNEDLPEFQGKVTTSEVIVQEIWLALEGHLPATLERVRLHETARNVFELSR